MTLVAVPITGVASVISKIARYDPETARLYTEMGLWEVLGDIIDVQSDVIEGVVAKAQARTVVDARRALVEVYVSKRLAGQDVSGVRAAALEMGIVEVPISKANRYREQLHRRDPYTGRWVIDVNTRRFGKPHAEVSQHLGGMIGSGIIRPGQKVMLRDKNGLEMEHTVLGSHTANSKKLEESFNAAKGPNDEKFRPTEILVDPNDSGAQAVRPRLGELGNENGLNNESGMAFDALSYATGSQAQAARLVPTQQQLGEKFSANLNQLVNGDTTSPGERAAFGQMRSAGGALRSVSTPGSGTYAAASVTQLAGSLGPEAERILGPGFARMTYKYRGTEKTPDPTLVRDVSLATRFVDADNRYAENPRSSQNPGGEPPIPEQVRGNPSPALGATHKHATNPALTPDQKLMLTRGDAAVSYFIGQMPDPQLAKVSLASGRVPPSVGAIISDRGQVVAEAMGTGEDHYLPFDLKNLTELRGGQYVRTRLAGGPTTEDIYTGLLTGTRQMQVVSNSGVFTMEFDPSLRGGRRYSDKARQMISRYSAMLDEINTGEVQEKDIPPRKMAELRALALSRTGDNPIAAREELDKLTTRERAKGIFAGEADEDEMRGEAHRQVALDQSGLSPDRVKAREEEVYLELQRQARDERASTLQLDGLGYYRSMQALKQEFPYFIRSVDWEPLEAFNTSRGLDRPGDPNAPRTALRMRDKGYVGPRQVQTRPREAWNSKEDRKLTPVARAAAAKKKRDDDALGGVAAPRSGPVGGGGSGGTYVEDPNPVTVPVPEGTNQLESIGTAGIERTVSAAVLALGRFIPLVAIPAPSDEEKKNPDLVRDAPGSYVKAVYAKAQNDNQSLGPAIAALSPLGRQAFIDGLKTMDETATADASDPTDAQAKNVRGEATTAQVTAAINAVKMLGKIKAPFAAPASDPLLYAPDAEAPPQRFEDVARLGDNAAAYAAYETEAAKQPMLAKAISDMAALDPAQRQARVRDQVNEYKNAKELSEKPNSKADPSRTYPTGVEDTSSAMRYMNGNPDPKAVLRQQQKAWAFTHARDIMNELGGGAGPKVAAGPAAAPPAGAGPGSPSPVGPTPPPAPAGPAATAVPPRQIGQFRGTQVAGGDPSPRPFGKSASTRLVVHPPGSPVAKAFARARASNIR